MKKDNKLQFQRLPIKEITFRTKRVSKLVAEKGIRSAFECYMKVIYGKDLDFTPMDVLDIQTSINVFGEEYVFTKEMVDYINEHVTDSSVNVYADWHSGMTYKTIGEKYGITANRASQIVNNIDRKIRGVYNSSPESITKLILSNRSYNALGRGGIYTIDELINAFEIGSIYKIRNFGVVSLKEIAEKLDAYKGTNFVDLIRGREKELINIGKNQYKNIPACSLIKNENDEIQNLVPFRFYRLIDTQANNVFSDSIMIHKDQEMRQLYFLVVRELSITTKLSEEHNYPIYNVYDKFYSPTIGMIVVNYDDYLKGKVKIQEYKLEG